MDLCGAVLCHCNYIYGLIFSFRKYEIEQKCLALAIAEELKQEAGQQAFLVTNKMKHCVESLSKSKQLQSKQRQLFSEKLSSRKS